MTQYGANNGDKQTPPNRPIFLQNNALRTKLYWLKRSCVERCPDQKDQKPRDCERAAWLPSSQESPTFTTYEPCLYTPACSPFPFPHSLNASNEASFQSSVSCPRQAGPGLSVSICKHSPSLDPYIEKVRGI